MTDYKNQNHSFCHIGWRYKYILQLVFVSFSGCTSGQQQFFRIPPSDVSAAIGQTTIISCVVGSQAGRVQWTKGGLTLGKHFNTALSNSNQRKLEKVFCKSDTDPNHLQCMVALTWQKLFYFFRNHCGFSFVF